MQNSGTNDTIWCTCSTALQKTWVYYLAQMGSFNWRFKVNILPDEQTRHVNEYFGSLNISHFKIEQSAKCSL